MNELEIQRKKIDEIDKQLLPLFLERMNCSKAVADYKREKGMAVLDKKREKEILDHKMSLVDSDKALAVRDFFSSIMSISRNAQRKLLASDKSNIDLDGIFDMGTPKANPTVVFQGVAGANSETALMKIFGEGCKRTNVMTFGEALDAVEKGDADYAVLPLENSSTGSISGVYDLLETRDFSIIGEVDVPIEHCLVALPDAKLSDIETVYSHEQGYLQCKEFFKSYPKIQFSAYYNTALAAKLISGMGDKTKAAISDPRCAEIYGLQILADNISTSHNNVTRFAAVAKRGLLHSRCGKISILFTLPNESGALSDILSEFSINGLNLVKIESRPRHDRNFEYMFFVDFEGNLLDEKVQRVMGTVAESTAYLKILGNYPLPKE
ncbi:MAG: chorismate mutase [Ruminococcaceae bacterium]|nr:chorismate mutase [Oscillospiraceae bacterium]